MNIDPSFLINMSTLVGAYITLFCCLHVSDFDVITSGFTAATSNASRLYFGAWYVMGVLLLLNIVKSFFLADFMGLVGRTGWKKPIPTEREYRNEEKGSDDVDEEKPDDEARPSISLAMRNRLIEKLTTPKEETTPSRNISLDVGTVSTDTNRINSSAVNEGDFGYNAHSVHSPTLLDTTYTLQLPDPEDSEDRVNDSRNNRLPLKGAEDSANRMWAEETHESYSVSTFNCKVREVLSYLIWPSSCSRCVLTVWRREGSRCVEQPNQKLVGDAEARGVSHAPRLSATATCQGHR